MLIDVLMVIGGLAGLYWGAEFLVAGASAMALRLGLTPLIVGCTVVAFGTSAPELLVSVAAVYAENDDISVGNIIGSNIANLALILGAAAMIRPIEIQSEIIRREYPVMASASLLLVFLAYDGTLSQLDGYVLLLGMACYTGYMVMISRMEMAAGKTPGVLDDVEDLDEDASSTMDIVKLVGGFIGLAIGSKLMVDGAVSIAQTFNVPEMLIGISIVAVGTSLPELATSIVASLRGASDISVGNVVGSNVFNSLLVLGVVASAAGVAVGPDAIRYDLWIMLAVTALVWPMMLTRRRIGRIEGSILLIGYFTYIGWLFFR